MIVVRVELHSAVTGEVTELARALICNDGTGTMDLRHYQVHALRGRSRAALDRNVVQRTGRVRDWPSQRLHVWNLVAAALAAMGYGREGAQSRLPVDDAP